MSIEWVPYIYGNLDKLNRDFISSILRDLTKIVQIF